MDRQELGRKKLEQDARDLRTLIPQWLYLTSPLTSGSWNGDSFSTTAKTVIDLSVAFSAPAGIKAILVSVYVRDSASDGNDYFLILAPNNVANQGFRFCAGPGGNDVYHYEAATVPCDANGDVFYQISASGAGTLDVWLYIWGYCI